MRAPNLYRVVRALSDAGIIFIDADQQGGVGVRFRQ
jgi:hypothetical protein